MISFDRWITTRIQYDDSYYIKDVLNECVKDVICLVNSSTELEFDYEKETFKDKFYQFIYLTYVCGCRDEFKPYDEDMYEYFTLKFSEDIINLFLRFKETTKGYNLDLFHKRNDVSLYLEDFLFNTLLVEDPYYDEDYMDLDEENYIDSIIYERYP